MKTTKRRGRPTRADASAKALQALAAAGLDPTKVDPRLILQLIASDSSLPATARVAACRALLAAPAESAAPDRPGRRRDRLLNGQAVDDRAKSILKGDLQ